MADQPWYHPTLTRVAAEEMLVANGKDGAFIIRDSDSFSNTMVLCLMYQSRVHHYRIYYRSSKYSVQTVAGVSQIYCDSLNELVSYYGTPGAGLVHHLQYPIEPEVEDEPSDDSDTEEDKPAAVHSAAVKVAASQNAAVPNATPYADTSDTSDYADVPMLVSTSSARNISKFLEQNFKNVDKQGVDDTFVGKVRSYVTDGALNDLEFVMSHPNRPYLLHQLMMESGAEAFQHLQKYTRQLMLLADFFDRCNGASGSSQFERDLIRAQSATVDFDEAQKRLTACQDLLSSIDTKATRLMSTVAQQYNPPRSVQRSASTSAGNTTSSSSITRTTATVERVVQSFETRMDFQVKSKTILNVDVEAGTLTVVRNNDRDPIVYNCHQIVQIIKSRSAKQKLGIRLDSKTRKDFVFNDNKSREVFCQLMQLIQKRSSSEQDISNISVFVGSFNMGDTPCPNDVQNWIKSQGQGKTLDKSLSNYPHDLYVIGTQESGTMGEKDWKNVLYQCTGIEMKLVEQATLWGIRLVIMVKPEHFNKISHVQTSQVRTGVANTLGNKGAVGVSLHFGGTSLCFICAHLTSGTEKCTRRNNNYRDILRGLALGQRGLQQFDLTSQFHHVFWFGDLNYRLQCEDEAGATAIVNHIKENNLTVLHEMDQLKREKEMGHVFCSFEEEALDFPPTYRYERGTRDVYAWRKEKKMSVRINVPSWCDRVLWKSYPQTNLQNTSYGCTTDITTSDHSPVFATFNMGIVNQYSSKDAGPATTATYVHFTYAAAIIGTSSRTTYYLEVHSECLNSSSRSVSNTSCLKSDQQTEIRKSCPRVLRHMLHDTSFPEWSHDQLERMSLQPILADEEYLMHQHFFIAVKSSDGDEVYGGGVVAAVDFFSQTPVEFGIELTRHGKATGYLRGSIYIPVRTTGNPYDHVSLIREEEFDAERAERASNFSPPQAPAASPVAIRGHSLQDAMSHLSSFRGSGAGHSAPLPVPTSSLPSPQAPGLAIQLSDIDAVRLHPPSSSPSARPPVAVPTPPPPPSSLSRRGPSASMRNSTPSYARDAADAAAPPVPTRPGRSRTTMGDYRLQGAPLNEDRPPLPGRPEGRPSAPARRGSHTPHSDVGSSSSGMSEPPLPSRTHPVGQPRPPQPYGHSNPTATRSSSDGPPRLPPANASGASAAAAAAAAAGAGRPAPNPHSALMRSRSSQMTGPVAGFRSHRLSQSDIDVTADATHPVASSARLSSTGEFLKNLGLSRYVEGFVTEGWDDAEFLHHMSLGDLKKCGVSSGAHQRQIMDALKSLHSSK